MDTVEQPYIEALIQTQVENWLEAHCSDANTDPFFLKNVRSTVLRKEKDKIRKWYLTYSIKSTLEKVEILKSLLQNSEKARSEIHQLIENQIESDEIFVRTHYELESNFNVKGVSYITFILSF